jgi:Fe-S-cluster-containing dehydrogenase component/formate-dependent nitrite reductase membrane component NrfD
MKYGFILDQRKCIGCHACTVACKSENDVPVGVFRTWVKYVEQGEFPNTHRSFAVLRCNHCEDAPCIEICPTNSLFKRDNGIVDFDKDSCIGCKACMQGCPYDALHIDDNFHTAAKCNFCAPRVEIGLQPACQIVCPTQAIVSGDLDNPESEISLLLQEVPSTVRKPEKGTKPQVFYLGADEAALKPSITRQAPSFLWAESQANQLLQDITAKLGESEWDIPLTVYDVPHKKPWGVFISLYLWTKSIAGGAMMVAALLLGLGLVSDLGLFGVAAAMVALGFLGVTGVFLVGDLKQPRRFLYIFLKPNFSSWLVKGSYVIAAFGAFCLVWLALALAGASGTMRLLSWLAVLLGGLTAGYTAFLFGQAKARDLWLSPLLLPHLLVQALVAGASAMLLTSLAMGASPANSVLLATALAVAVPVNAAIMLGDLLRPHPTLDARRAARTLISGPYRMQFWLGAVVCGFLAPEALTLLFLVGAVPPAVVAVGAVLALAGLLAFEDGYVKAGQSVPIS